MVRKMHKFNLHYKHYYQHLSNYYKSFTNTSQNEILFLKPPKYLSVRSTNFDYEKHS